MRHRKRRIILDRNSQQRHKLLRNLVISFIMQEKITTTHAKAKMLRSAVERAITVGKRKDLAARRQLIDRLGNLPAVHRLLTTLADRYQKRAGGFTRVIKVGSRAGDRADQSRLELV